MIAHAILPRRLGIWLLLVVALSTAGCSMTRLGYGQLDSIAAWTADEYFDLDTRQKQDLLARFERLQAWHRRRQLPEYASFLAAAAERIRKGLTNDDVEWFTDGVKMRYRTLASHGSDDAAALLATLASAQIDALQRQWEKDNRKFVREHRLDGTAEEQKRARARRILSRIKDWTGGLGSGQEQKIINLSNDLQMIERLRYEDWLRRQREFLVLLKRRGEGAVFAAQLKHWLLHWEEGRAPEYDRLLTAWWAQRVQFFVAVDHMLTPGQRAAVLHRLRDYADDFRDLSGSARQAASG